MSARTPEVASDYLRLRFWLISAYLGVVAIAATASGLFLWSAYGQALDAATVKTTTLTRALEEHVLRTFGAIDVQLRQAGRQLVDARVLEQPATPAVIELLRKAKPEGDFVRSLYAYDALGHGHSTSFGADISKARARDFEYINEIFQSGTDRLAIGRVVPGLVTQRPGIQIARGFLDREGRFAGIVGSTLEPAYFELFYKALGLAPGESLALIRLDGTVLARFPEASGVPVKISNSVLFRERLAQEQSGTLQTTSLIDGNQRIISYRRVPGWNLVVVNSVERAAVLAPWRRIVVVVALALVISMGVLWAILLLALREVRRRADVEERFALAVRGSDDGIWDWNLRTHELYLSPRWKAILGYRDEEIPNNDASAVNLIHPDDRAMVQQAFRDHLGKGKPYRVEQRMLHKDGGTRWVLTRGEVLRNASGQAVRMAGSISDISARKHAAEQLALSESRLREAQALAHIGNWDLDLVSGALHWSDEIFRIFELAPESFAPTYEAFLRLVHPEDRDLLDRTYQESIANHKRYELVHRLMMPDGRIKHVQEHGQTIYDAHGTPLRSTGTVQDISLLREAELALRALNDELESRVNERTQSLTAANRELETFTYSVSHDLKSPLRGIVGYTRLLQDGYADKLDAEGAEFLANVRIAATQMDQLIDDLLAYSRLEKRVIQTTPVDLHGLVDSLLIERSREIDSTSAQVEQVLPAEAVLNCDREGLSIALRNLLQNALKFYRPGTPPVIQIGARDQGGSWLVWVRDNGIGFDMKFHDRIFAIFQRLHRSEDYPGTGIGLAIVKKALERMGGRAWAESKPGTGTIFNLEVPK